MTLHLYLSLTPEALISSMLGPEAFGTYYATSTEKKAREAAIFFEIDPNFREDSLRIENGYARCIPHENGSPKRSVCVSVYRVLERMCLDAIRKLYVVTQDERALGLEPISELPDSGVLSDAVARGAPRQTLPLVEVGQPIGHWQQKASSQTLVTDTLIHPRSAMLPWAPCLRNGGSARQSSKHTR